MVETKKTLIDSVTNKEINAENVPQMWIHKTPAPMFAVTKFWNYFYKLSGSYKHKSWGKAMTKRQCLTLIFVSSFAHVYDLDDKINATLNDKTKKYMAKLNDLTSLVNHQKQIKNTIADK